MVGRFEAARTEQANSAFQRRMAESLLAAGLDEAIEIAAFNDWRGVLRELYGLKRGRSRDGGRSRH